MSQKAYFLLNDVFYIGCLIIGVYGFLINTEYFDIAKYTLLILEILSILLCMFVPFDEIVKCMNQRNFIIGTICTLIIAYIAFSVGLMMLAFLCIFGTVLSVLKMYA